MLETDKYYGGGVTVMNYSTYRITLDVRNTVSNVQLTAKKGDAGRKVYITLSDKGKPCEIADGSYAVFAGVKPDGKLLYNKTTIENNTIIYEMTQQTTAVAGLVACEVKLFDSMSNLLTSPKLTIWVDDVVVPDEEIVSKDEVTALAELVFEANKVIDLGNQTIAAGNAATEATIAATTAATEATQNANAATTEANTATDSANNAAASANAAASNATQETYSANIAATNANNAASDARIATEETNTARENIQRAVSEVLTSLSNAVFAPPIESSASGAVVAVNDASNYLLSGLTIYGKATQNGTQLETAGASGTINITVAGKNLAPPFIVGQGISSSSGAIRTDGTEASTDLIPINVDQPNTWGNPISNLRCAVFFYNEKGEYMGRNSVSARSEVRISKNIMTVVSGKSGKITYIRLYQGEHTSCDGTIGLVSSQPPMLNVGETAEVYEPYKAPQIITVQTPNGLPGIPVTSGGNYTDESGQQWKCNEIDFARGVYMQNVGVFTSDGTENWVLDTTNVFGYKKLSSTISQNRGQCSHFVQKWVGTGSLSNGEYTLRDAGYVYVKHTGYDTVDAFKAWLAEQYANGTPFTLHYQLATPIETPLSAEEMEQYASLHTNKPNTTVYNDAGADMKLEYVADTKTFFTQQIAAISAAMLNK
jgi:hypothetical protein